MEVIILAGGFGTRLQSVVKSVPKPMADVNSKPFLEYIMEYLSSYNITKIILSVGYKKEIIQAYFGNKYKKIPIVYSCENEPLGTGGAIKQALTYLSSTLEDAVVLNGDTFFDINLYELAQSHLQSQSLLTLSLKEMKNFDRYGRVRIQDNKVISFEEKKFHTQAYINAGVYMLNKNLFDKLQAQAKFSFEEFLNSNVENMKINSFLVNEAYFIDIGIPQDYEKVKLDFALK
ncbi:MAG: nucleotidyltransferase family protein [Sulfurimonas sp.]|nr:nucleotidyltransferase family protein [Sulfurimonas sp.]